jgi:uroporphyrinogen-III synthase
VAGQVTVVVTRPGEPGRKLADELHRAGQPALWLPAFEFGPAPDEAAARAALAAAAGFDLAVFVSPQAARVAAALIDRPWPSTTAIAAVGSGTRDAVLASIAGAAGATMIAPADDDNGSGSEALWPLLQERLPLRRVLLLRAQEGREWLADRLRESGAQVLAVAVYSRRPHAPAAAMRARLAAAAAGEIAIVISSSDAVDALAAMLASQPAVLQALRAGRALASHPRIAERLRAAGFRRVVSCSAERGAVLATLRGH